jgi:predicted alpha/beta-fold hydrolase
MYHSGETDDVTWVLQELRDRFPDRRVGGMGFSLGGNILLKLLGERDDGGAGILDAAAAMSVPYDLDAGCQHLESGGMGHFYTWYFLRSLRRKILAKATLLADRIDLDDALDARSLRLFDDAATAPLHGFRDAGEYYRLCSSGPFLPAIRVPTLLLHSLDDPFLPEDALPMEAMEANPWLTPVLTRKGGHVGFLEGPPWRPRFWGDEETARFLAERLQEE